ncbi:hypothetical protein, partial [Klebsiella pneumoniae]|uniref:hypothetical protein n=1 Tax=Klebsiella pneumoniae TaxID=573 RepID=UPI0040559B65
TNSEDITFEDGLEKPQEVNVEPENINQELPHSSPENVINLKVGENKRAEYSKIMVNLKEDSRNIDRNYGYTDFFKS